MENHLALLLLWILLSFEFAHTHSTNRKEIQTHLSHKGLGIGTFH